MELTSVFMIDGNQVEKQFEKGDICVYSHTDMEEVTLYFVNKASGKVMFKGKVTASCNQNFALIDNVHFEGVK